MNIAPLSDWTPETLSNLWHASPCATFAGEINNAHQMISVSADCCLENHVSAWTAPPTLQNSAQAKLFKDRVKLAMEVAKDGTCNFAFCFDGRSREARRVIEESLPTGDSFAELWITYAGKLHKTHTRKVVASQFNREACFIKMPVSRVSVLAKDRQD